MIETFFFDMGNVLVHFSHERMCRQMADVCALTPAEVRRLLFDSGIQGEFEKGRITEQNLHARLEKESRRKLDFDALVHAASDIFEAAIAVAGSPAERCFYTDDIAEYVAAGRRHGLQAEVFTTADSLRGHLRERGIELPAGA